jgi:26S proteasome regulatory subunit N1
MSKPAMGALLVFLHCCLDMKRTILDKSHYLMYHLASAMMPRLLLTVDTNLNLLPVSVRVGQAVETVGQAGRPKTITGFQTHTTPVLLGVNDRAELATDSVRALSSYLEGIVILE